MYTVSPDQVMIRAKPTSIELGPSDIDDYEQRRRRRNAKAGNLSQAAPQQNQLALPIRTATPKSRICGPSVHSIPSNDGSHLANQTNRQSSLSHVLHSPTSPLDNLETKLLELSKVDLSFIASSSSGSDDYIEDGYSMLVEASELQVDEDEDETEDDNELLEELATQRLSSPFKDDFHYGGFVESPSRETNHPAQPSSPFEPDETSTPPRLLPPSTQRLYARGRLPRSPLFLAQNASSSPERQPTASLTPRVVSRIATHNTPGIIFSQPARRAGVHTIRQPRTLRHQTNSFSFDDSERSSVAYEQERVSSSSTTDSIPRPTESLNLRQELRGSSLQSSRRPSLSASAHGVAETESSAGHPSNQAEYAPEADADQYSEEESSNPGSPTIEQILASAKSSDTGSPQLPLPPPFSTVSRSVSRAGSLPSSPQSDKFPETSPIRSPSESLPRRAPNPTTSSPASPGTREHDLASTSSPSSGDRRKRTTIVQAAVRIMSGYRARSPLHRSPPTTRPSPPPSPSPQRRTQRRPTPRKNSVPVSRAYTPSRNYAVYNDSLPASSQPQTPAHLPEARHQSRYHPSYTAPTTRSMARTRGLFTDGNQTSRGTPSQPSDTLERGTSPVGLTDDGFRGLYGGRENGDEERTWIDGVRARNAEMRTWQTRRNLDDSPGPEEEE
ncbi:hypothetical protein CJF30_00007395 [Rutstroemia sp. NJR-2017a BBW]|nr:hypothetical protein CJF30_00007395 [Rutstroemia sp. NJR-2017a BBW]